VRAGPLPGALATVESVEEWWFSEGQKQFPEAERLLILADAGGSNSCRSILWHWRSGFQPLAVL
jgi:hypothetical protein